MTVSFEDAIFYSFCRSWFLFFHVPTIRAVHMVCMIFICQHFYPGPRHFEFMSLVDHTRAAIHVKSPVWFGILVAVGGSVGQTENGYRRTPTWASLIYSCLHSLRGES
jgi:hypothetical protein